MDNHNDHLWLDTLYPGLVSSFWQRETQCSKWHWRSVREPDTSKYVSDQAGLLQQLPLYYPPRQTQREFRTDPAIDATK